MSRTYHGNHPVGRGRALYADEGIRADPGGLIGAFTVDIGDLSSIVQLWGYDSLEERDRRRDELQAEPEEGSWRADPADPHPAQPHPVRLVLAAAMSALEGKVAIVTAARRASAERSPTGSPPRRGSSSPTCRAPRRRRRPSTASA